MADRDQGFELLSFIWARYPYRLSRYTVLRCFIVYGFADDPDSTLYKALADTTDPTDRAKAAAAYQGSPYKDGVGFVSDIDALDWRYVNLFLLQEWLQNPSPAAERIPDEAWAIAENIHEYNPPDPLPPSADGVATGDDGPAGTDGAPTVKAIADEIRAQMARYREAMRENDDPLAELTALIEMVLTESIAAFVADKDVAFEKTFNSLWQSLFALVVAPRDPTPLLPSRLVLLMRIVSLVDRLAADAPDPALGGDDQAAAIRDAIAATSVLPAAAFPLPAAPDGGDAPGGADTWLQPMAVGELKRVRQTLDRYEAGEIAHIETVLRGEIKNRTRRHLKVTEETLDDETSLRDAARRVLANDSVTGDGRWSKTEPLGYHETRYFKTDGTCSSLVMTPGQPSGGASALCSDSQSEASADDGGGDAFTAKRSASGFAQTVTEDSASEIRRRIREQVRARRLEETEETDCHSFDNRAGVDGAAAGEGNVVGVYRWVDKVYRARLDDAGRFLLLEVLIPAPARRFTEALVAREVPRRPRPVPPSELSPPITGYGDITSDNYADLAVRYAARGVEPPPAPRTIAAEFRNALPLGEPQELAVPAGYEATTATVAFAPATAKPTVLIGGASYSDNLDKPITLPDATTGPLPVQVVVPAAPNGATDGADDDPVAFFANVDVACKPSPTLTTAWQVATYEAVLAGYAAQLVAYERGLGGEIDRSEWNNPGGVRTVERQEIKKDAVRILLTRPFGPYAGGAAPDEPDLMVERYLQLFDEAFAWREMTYTFYPYLWCAASGAAPAAGTARDIDPAFSEFVDAAYARLILPVTAGYELIVLLYVALGGRVWVGGNETAPVAEHYMAFADDLKAPAADPDHGSERSPTWTVTVPTSFVTLDERAALPSLSPPGPGR